jgi:hypothetical protein
MDERGNRPYQRPATKRKTKQADGWKVTRRNPATSDLDYGKALSDSKLNPASCWALEPRRQDRDGRDWSAGGGGGDTKFVM